MTDDTRTTETEEVQQLIALEKLSREVDACQDQSVGTLEMDMAVTALQRHIDRFNMEYNGWAYQHQLTATFVNRMVGHGVGRRGIALDRVERVDLIDPLDPRIERYGNILKEAHDGCPDGIVVSHTDK